ncbi:MAG: type II toxin-antitoxin system RelE/ParE family toxin [Solidesulfovibrio sp.]
MVDLEGGTVLPGFDRAGGGEWKFGLPGPFGLDNCPINATVFFMKLTVDYYETLDGKVIVEEWLDKIKNIKTRVQILRRITKIEEDAHFGDHKYLRDEISELRIHLGPGYRIYYSEIDGNIVILLCAGSKKGQESDITKAIKYLEDYKWRAK